MKALILLLAHASSEHINTTVSTRDLRSPLHLACACGNLAIAQLLIWVSNSLRRCIAFNDSRSHHYFQNQANIKQTDHEGRTCLAYAKAALSLATAKTINPSPHIYSVEATTGLVELLTGLGCTTDAMPLTSSGTLPRRNTVGPLLPSSVI